MKAALFVAGALVFREAPHPSFRHLSGEPEKRYILEVMGSGVALFDYDGDSDLDVFLVNASTLSRLEKGLPGERSRLFRNEGGFAFEDVTDAAGIYEAGFGQGAAAADVDNDGDLDLYVTNYGPNVFYRNEGDGTFSKVAAGIEDSRWGASAAFGDVDADGFLDLYLANYLDFDRALLDRLIPRQFCEWKGLRVNCGPRGFSGVSGRLFHNGKDGAFEDWTERSGVENLTTYPLGALFSDLDRDGDPDLYVATDSTGHLLFENLGGGRFRDVSLASGASLSQLGKEQAGMGVDSGDVNGDGLFDLFVTNFSDDYNTLYLNRGRLSFTDSSDVSGLGVASLPYLGWSTCLADFDADSDLDIFLVNGHVYPQVDEASVGESFRQPMQLFANRGTGTFDEVTSLSGSALGTPRSSRGAAVGDLDGDRDQDMVVNVHDGPPVVLENLLSGEANVLVLRLVGREGNRDAIGAVVTAVSRGNSQVREVKAGSGYLSQSDSRIYVGLGEAKGVDSLRIRWPSGLVEALDSVASGEVTVLEGKGMLPR